MTDAAVLWRAVLSDAYQIEIHLKALGWTDIEDNASYKNKELKVTFS